MEDVEKLLERVEHKKPAPPEEQPEVPTQTGEVHIREEQLEKPSQVENSTIQEMFRVMTVSYTHLSLILL